MADNYLEKRMEQYRSRSSSTQGAKTKEGLSSLLVKNRSTRGYDASYGGRADQLRRIVAVNTKLASARNRQPLRFRLVTADEAHKVLPLIRMGAGLKELNLPFVGTEPNAFIVVCSTEDFWVTSFAVTVTPSNENVSSFRLIVPISMLDLSGVRLYEYFT